MTKSTTPQQTGTKPVATSNHNASSSATAHASTNARNGSPTGAPRHDDDTLRLAALRSLKVSGPMPFTDVRGWRVQTNDERVIGSVTRMLVEQQPELTVRYLDVRVDPKAAGMKEAEPFDVIVPIGCATIIKGGTGIALPDLASGDIATLPRLREGPVTWERELEVAKAFGAKQPADSSAALYRQRQFDIATFQREHAPTT